MMKFEEWFKNKLGVGPMPTREITEDIVINVSDEYMVYDVNSGLFWFPMNECRKDIGLNSIYGAIHVLFRAYQADKTVYLHCHAGVNRSQTVRCAFHYAVTGRHVMEEWNVFANVLLRNCAYGYLPPRVEMEAFLGKLGGHLVQGTAVSLDKLKLDTIHNF